jgi:hypothetical protein
MRNEILPREKNEIAEYQNYLSITDLTIEELEEIKTHFLQMAGMLYNHYVCRLKRKIAGNKLKGRSGKVINTVEGD